MYPNKVKAALAAGELQLGTGFWQMRSAEVARIYAAAGFHWTFIDTEHGGFDLETVQDICRVASMAGLCPLVRVGDMQYPLVARALDCGAQGIVFPRVESPELLELAVKWTRFPPQGIRGYGLSGPQLNYTPRSFSEAIAHYNANTLVVLQIETVRAFEMRDELISIPGIDAVMIGPSDLSISLGQPGNFEHPVVVEHCEAIRDTCVKHGVAPGIHTRNPSLARFWKARGMRFLGCGNELNFMMERAIEVVKQIQAE